MANNAIEFQGTKLYIQTTGDSPTTYTQVKGLTSLTALDGQASQIDISDSDSTAREYLMGLQDNGSLSADFNWLPDDPGQLLMRAAKASRDIQDFRIVFSDLGEATFKGFVLGAPISGAVDDKMTSSMSILVSGDVNLS